MKPKKRVVTDGHFFYPQRKGLFGWKFYFEPAMPCIDGWDMGDEIVRFKTTKEAFEFQPNSTYLEVNTSHICPSCGNSDPYCSCMP